MKRTRQRQKNIARLAIQIVDERRQCSQLRVLQEREGHISDQSVQRRPVQHPVRCQSCRQQDHHIRIALRLGHIALDEVAPEPLPELEVTPRRSDQRLEVSRDQARHLKRATVRDLRKYVGMPLPPRKPEQSGYHRCPLLRRQCPASHQQQVDITLRAEPRRRTGAIEVDPDDPTGIGREHSVEYRLDQIVHINGDYAPEAPRGNACIVQPRTRIAQVESKLTRTRVRSKHPSDQGLYTLNLNSTQFWYIHTSRDIDLAEWSNPRVGRCRRLPSVLLVDARNQPLCMVSELVQRRSVVTRDLQPPQVVAECLRPSHEGIKVVQPPLAGVRGPRLLHNSPTVSCPQRPLGVEPDIKPLPLVAELIDESEHRDAQVRQAITDRLGGWVEADEPLHRFLQRRPKSVGGGASRLSKSLLRAPVGPVGADAGDDQGETRDDEGGDVHELIISSARPNARCTTHCRRPAKFADHGGSARASVRPTESSSATCEATPATNMNPE